MTSTESVEAVTLLSVAVSTFSSIARNNAKILSKSSSIVTVAWYSTVPPCISPSISRLSSLFVPMFKIVTVTSFRWKVSDKSAQIGRVLAPT